MYIGAESFDSCFSLWNDGVNILKALFSYFIKNHEISYDLSKSKLFWRLKFKKLYVLMRFMYQGPWKQLKSGGQALNKLRKEVA